jgi:lipopolysaccharide export system protein LptA
VKRILSLFLLASSFVLPLHAQTAPAVSATPGPMANAGILSPSAKMKSGPMEITATKEASYEDRTRRAIFVGDVQVKNPEFTLTAEKLTTFFRKGTGNSPAQKTGASAQSELAKQFGSGSIEKVLAEGKVVITRLTPGANGAEPTRYTGRAERVEYDAASGNVTLSGWPKVQQGINSHFATDASTVMIVNRDGQMKTIGQSKTVIEDTGREDKL